MAALRWAPRRASRRPRPMGYRHRGRGQLRRPRPSLPRPPGLGAARSWGGGAGTRPGQRSPRLPPPLPTAAWPGPARRDPAVCREAPNPPRHVPSRKAREESPFPTTPGSGERLRRRHFKLQGRLNLIPPVTETKSSPGGVVPYRNCHQRIQSQGRAAKAWEGEEKENQGGNI